MGPMAGRGKESSAQYSAGSITALLHSAWQLMSAHGVT